MISRLEQVKLVAIEELSSCLFDTVEFLAKNSLNGTFFLTTGMRMNRRTRQKMVGCQGLNWQNLEVLLPQNILHRNNDRDMLTIFRLWERGFKVENNLSPTSLCKLFELENEEWLSPTQIYNQYSIFNLFESCKRRPILN